jgi:DNA-binding NarL/FixJ family response regulator
MEIHVAVVDPLPLYRRGVTATLSDIGIVADAPDDIRAWTADRGTGVVLLSLCTPADWQLLAELHAMRRDVLLLALIDPTDTGAHLRALSSGALSALPRASSPEALQETVTALINGQVILPVAVVRSLIDTQRRTGRTNTPTPSPQELTWLRRLAEGSTVAQLAQSACYSERMMFRRLRTLYSQLSARNRTEALMYARDKGWI